MNNFPMETKKEYVNKKLLAIKSKKLMYKFMIDENCYENSLCHIIEECRRTIKEK